MPQQLSIFDSAFCEEPPTGRALRDAGIEQVVANEPTWSVRFRDLIDIWFATLPSQHIFTGEVFRQLGRASGLEEPHHPNAWGGVANSVIKTWLRDERIHIVGIKGAVAPANHAHAYRQYMKVR